MQTYVLEMKTVNKSEACRLRHIVCIERHGRTIENQIVPKAWVLPKNVYNQQLCICCTHAM
jgi:hypothetical protein